MVCNRMVKKVMDFWSGHEWRLLAAIGGALYYREAEVYAKEYE